MRPGEVKTPERLAQAGFDDLPDEVRLELLHEVFGFVAPAIAEAAPDPHWHLRLLAVEPTHQGGGLGALRRRHGIERAAASGHALVLETFSERAMRFYLDNGFEILLDGVDPTSGLHFAGPPTRAPAIARAPARRVSCALTGRPVWSISMLDPGEVGATFGHGDA